MKIRLTIYSLVAVLMLGVWTGYATSAQTDFSGTWSLDTEKTPNVPPHIGSYTMVVTQDQLQFTVEATIKNDFKPMGEPGGMPSGEPPNKPEFRGSPGLGGGPRPVPFGMGFPKATYKLDGSETTIETEGPIPGTSTLKAKWANGGKVLEQTIIQNLNFPDRTVTHTIKERWELSSDGQWLQVSRIMETPGGRVPPN